METTVKIKIIAGGPFLVEGGAVITDKNGNETRKEEIFALCRCGQSLSKPYCDGSHKKTEFDK